MSTSDAEKVTEAVHPPGEYAIVELFGHTTLVGRIAECERFGAKLLAVEPLFNGTLLPAVFHGGAAIYRLTPVSAEVAFNRQPTHLYQLPTAVRSIVPPAILPAGTADTGTVHEVEPTWEDADDDRPF